MLSKHPATELCLPMLNVLNNRQTFWCLYHFISLQTLYQVSHFSACLPTLAIFCPFWFFQPESFCVALAGIHPGDQAGLLFSVCLSFPPAAGWLPHCGLVWVFLLAKVSGIISSAFPLSIYLLWRCAYVDLCSFLNWVVCLYYWIGRELGIF